MTRATRSRFDVIVCGAGSAGAILAARLSEDPARSVLLLEAGPDYPDLGLRPDELKYGRITGPDVLRSRHSWQSSGIGPGGRTLAVARGKVTGGSSAISGPTVLRGVPEDYDRWASLGNDRWSFRDVLPAFRALETDLDFANEFHGTDGPVVIGRFEQPDWQPAQTAFYEACRATGFPDSEDLNHPDATGVGPTPMSTLTDERWSTASGYLDAARRRRNLTLAPDCTVGRVLLRAGRANGVEVVTGGRLEAIEGDEVVVSAGAVGSPQLLLRSGIGPARDLHRLGIPVEADRRGVGRNLADHPAVTLLYRTRPGFTLDPSAPLRQVTLRYTAADSGFRNDMKINAQSYATDASRVPIGIALHASVQLPTSAGDVQLTSRDPNDQPAIRLGYLEDGFDLGRLREGVRSCTRLAEQEAFRGIVEGCVSPTRADLASDDALDDWLLRNVHSAQHLAGTCKMGPETDDEAVVDQLGRVHGVAGLRVVDASIMPQIVRANTNLTTMMLAERMAGFVSAR